MSYREGMFVRSTDDVIEEKEIFSGDQNRLMFQQVYSKDFKESFFLFSFVLFVIYF
jgi:hypothetical protein